MKVAGFEIRNYLSWQGKDCLLLLYIIRPRAQMGVSEISR